MPGVVDSGGSGSTNEDELLAIRNNRLVMRVGLEDFRATSELASYGRLQHNDYRDDVKWIAAFSSAAILAATQLARDERGLGELLVGAVILFLLSIGSAIAYVWRPYRLGIQRLGKLKLTLADYSKVASQLTFVYDELEAALTGHRSAKELAWLREKRDETEAAWQALPDPAQMPAREILEARVYALLSLLALLVGLTFLFAYAMGPGRQPQY